MRKALLAVAALLLLAASAGPVAARFGMPEPLTERGEVVADIYAQIAVVGIVVFLLVFVLLVVVLVRYREGSGKGRATHEKHRGSLAAEMVWTVIPLLIMLWIGYIAYVGLVKLDLGETDTEPEMAVTVTGYQWAWEMDYGQGVKVFVNPSAAADGSMSYSDTFHLPAGVPIRMNVTGADVIHAFNIMDANRAYVSMDDANPYGPHKQHSQVLTFPAGTYSIQCKEMCMNPGHAYMRAELVVEPQAQFDRWLEERTLAVGKDLVQTVPLTLDADSMDGPGDVRNMTIATGTRVILVLANTHSQPIDVRLPGGVQNVTVPAGQSALAYFDTGVVADFVLESSNGGTFTFKTVDAQTIEVTLRSYEILPDVAEMEAGKTYLIRVKGMDSIHNYFIGHWDGKAGSPKEILGQSPNVGAGGVASFVYTPTEAGTFDAWCDISGHYGAGMHATAEVAAA